MTVFRQWSQDGTATLSGTLSTSTTYSSATPVPVTSLPALIPANDYVIITQGSHSDTFQTTGAALGATGIPVSGTWTPSFAYTNSATVVYGTWPVIVSGSQGNQGAQGASLAPSGQSGLPYINVAASSSVAATVGNTNDQGTQVSFDTVINSGNGFTSASLITAVGTYQGYIKVPFAGLYQILATISVTSGTGTVSATVGQHGATTPIAFGARTALTSQPGGSIVSSLSPWVVSSGDTGYIRIGAFGTGGLTLNTASLWYNTCSVVYLGPS